VARGKYYIAVCHYNSLEDVGLVHPCECLHVGCAGFRHVHMNIFFAGSVGHGARNKLVVSVTASWRYGSFALLNDN
jgi:hypothetical protein